ncbi:MAG TPA: hypothetical protein VGW38_16760, partial [Chloroflexota bacterium]|nr:hypothetical protein [Chloroflexota bacterium]
MSRLIRRLAPLCALLVVCALMPLQAAPADASWKTAGLASAVVSRLVVDGSAPGLVYALARNAGARSGLVKSVDGGKSWFPLDRGLPAGFQPHLLAISPHENQKIIAASADAVYRSTTGGAAWTRISPYMPALTAVHFDVADPRRVLAGTELRGNFQSSDGGVTWSPANRGLPRDRYGFT